MERRIPLLTWINVPIGAVCLFFVNWVALNSFQVSGVIRGWEFNYGMGVDRYCAIRTRS
jgi:hypothetical protein